MPEPEVAESGFAPDGNEVALFPDAVAPLPDVKPSAKDTSGSKGGSQLIGLAIAIGVAVAVFALVVILALGKKSKNDAEPDDASSELAPPPAPGSDFRG